jgi:hypothetical protein
MLFRIGDTNADTEVYFIKAMDNCVDWHLGNFDTDLTEDWAEEDFRQFPTTEDGVRAEAEWIEVITYQP